MHLQQSTNRNQVLVRDVYGVGFRGNGARHFLAEVDANSDLPLVDLPGVGDRAWLYKRLEGPSHANNQQQMTILKANLIIQVATDDSPKKLPATFETRMTALGRAITATAT